MVIMAYLGGMPLHAKGGPECWVGSKAPVTKKLSSFVLQLTPLPEKVSRATGDGCRAELFNSQRKVIFSASDWSFSVVLTGQDVNGERKP